MASLLDCQMWQLLDNIATTLGFPVTAVGLIIAAVTYKRSVQLRRAEWLHELYSKFYEQDQYKEMRWILDYEPEDKIQILRECVEEALSAAPPTKQIQNRALVEALVDYLNFFEFIASLWRLGQLSLEEVRMVFEYYILRLGDHDFVCRFLALGFENLRNMLTQLRASHES